MTVWMIVVLLVTIWASDVVLRLVDVCEVARLVFEKCFVKD
jgi:hypothetical protein